MTINDIVDKIRHQTQWINNVNVGVAEMYQPLYLDQYRIIEALLDAGVYIDVIVSTGILLEDGSSLMAKSSISDKDNIFHELKENKSVLFYFWAVLPSDDHKLRYAKSSTIAIPKQRYRKELNA